MMIKNSNWNRLEKGGDFVREKDKYDITSLTNYMEK